MTDTPTDRWLADADRIRDARADGYEVDVLPGGGILVSDANGPVDYPGLKLPDALADIIRREIAADPERGS